MGQYQGIRIPKDILKKLDLENVEDVEFELTPYEQLFVGYDLNKKRAQFNWDDPQSN